MVMMVVFAFVVVIMICGGLLLARLATIAKSKKSWIWGFLILFVGGMSSVRFSPFG